MKWNFISDDYAVAELKHESKTLIRFNAQRRGTSTTWSMRIFMGDVPGATAPLVASVEVADMPGMVWTAIPEHMRQRAIERLTSVAREVLDPLICAAGAHTIASLTQTANNINRANGWDVLTPADWEERYRIPTSLMLLTSEVAEALEAFREDDRASFEEELADVAIRLMDMCGGLGIDLEARILAKLEKNRTRGYRHGGKKV